jgi:cell division transport system permease protein
MRALAYAWQEAVTSLARARWTLLLSIATIAVAFAMLGAFRVVSGTVERVAGGWSEAAEVSVYLDDVVTEAEQAAIRQVIDRSGVTSGVTLVSKEQALARFGAEFPELGDVTASLDANPFPASFEVRLSEAGMAGGADALAASLAALPGVADVRFDRQWLSRLIAVITALRTAAGSRPSPPCSAPPPRSWRWSGSRSSAPRGNRHQALVGAPVAFIRGLFVVEGVIQGALGALAALGGLSLLGRALTRRSVRSPRRFSATTPSAALLWTDIAGLLAGGALVGAAAGLLATWKWDPQGPLAR